MKTLPLSEVKAKLSKLVGDVETLEDRVLITRNGRGAAVLISESELSSLEATLDVMSDPDLMAQIESGIEDFKKGRYREYASVDELFAELEGTRGDRPSPRAPRRSRGTAKAPSGAASKGARRAGRARGRPVRR